MAGENEGQDSGTNGAGGTAFQGESGGESGAFQGEGAGSAQDGQSGSNDGGSAQDGQSGAGDSSQDSGEQGAKEGSDSQGQGESGSAQDGQSGAPESYSDFTLPEGAVNEALMSQFVATSKERGLNQEQAQDRLDDLLSFKSEYDAQQVEAWQEQATAWTQQSVQLGMFRGDNLKAAEAGLRLVAQAQGDANGTLGALLTQLKLDKHPGIIEVFAAYGRAHAGDGDIGVSAAAGGQGGRDHASVLFDKSDHT